MKMRGAQDATFARLVEEHGPMLARFAASFERNRHAREDLLQDILLGVWQALPAFRGDASLKTYILGVAHRRCASHVMREVAQPRHEELDDAWVDCQPGPEALAGLNQQQARLLSALRDLPVGQRQLVVLALEGLRYDEIADLLGITVGNVGVRLNRARAALREQLEER
jgi:RNA polymerase sigma factor (sigma-70 family)